MKQSQTLAIRASEVRARLNELAGIVELDDAQRGELDTLTGEYRDVEARYRAALTSESAELETREAGEPADPETREARELLGKAQLHRWAAAAVRGRSVDGIEAETGAAFGCAGLIPLELLGEARAVEHRAITPAPATGTPQNMAAILPAVFDRTAAAWLGVEMPTVAAGTASYPVITSSVEAAPKAKGAAAPETAGTISPFTVTPRRITGAFRIAREDEAMLPGLESALRGNLSSVLGDQVDAQVVAGDNVAPNLNGVNTQLTAPTAPAAAAETFDRYVAAVASHVEGLYAVSMADVRMLVGPHTYRHAAATFRGTDGETAAQTYLASHTGGFRASRRIADPASHIQRAIVRRTAPGRAAVAPVWQGVELVRDPYTAAGKGETVLTVILLMGGVAILRPSAFVADSFRLSA